MFLRLSATVAITAFAAVASGCGPTCKESAPDGVTMKLVQKEDIEGFLDQPWPSDARKRPDGTLRLRDFQNPTQSSTLDEYLTVIADETRGFGRTTAVYVGFDGAIAQSSLPVTPIAATADDATVYLVNVDPDSPSRGARVPIETRVSKQQTMYLAANHLIALPPFGIVLEPNTTYALVATDGLEAADGGSVESSQRLQNALNPQCEASADAEVWSLFEPLRALLADEGKDPDEVVAATVYTTADTIGEIRRLGDAARALPVPEIRDLVVEEQRPVVSLIRGTMQMPGFQSGDVPYQKYGDGGGIAWGPDGVPVVDHYETTRVGFMIPNLPMPATGWPVVVMSHGTGADYASAFEPQIASVLAERGIAIVSYDPTLHGPRDPTGADETLTFFNLFNILAGRDNMRQGAADCVVITKLVQSGFEVPGRFTPTGVAARFDASKVAFLGHSQGGLVGSACLAVEPAFKAAVFSGTAGVLNITLQERKDPVDFESLLGTLLSLDDAEKELVDDMHPVLNLMQTFIEPADPIAYAPSFLSDPPDGANRDILLIEGFLDSASPARGHEAFAAAMGIPVVSPAHRIPTASKLLGVEPIPAPAMANAETAAGAVTAGLIQYPARDHWPYRNDLDANARYVEFIVTALFNGRAQIIRSQYE